MKRRCYQSHVRLLTPCLGDEIDADRPVRSVNYLENGRELTGGTKTSPRVGVGLRTSQESRQNLPHGAKLSWFDCLYFSSFDVGWQTISLVRCCRGRFSGWLAIVSLLPSGSRVNQWKNLENENPRPESHQTTKQLFCCMLIGGAWRWSNLWKRMHLCQFDNLHHPSHSKPGHLAIPERTEDHHALTGVEGGMWANRPNFEQFFLLCRSTFFQIAPSPLCCF
jgi:hypothetical protein